MDQLEIDVIECLASLAMLDDEVAGSLAKSILSFTGPFRSEEIFRFLFLLLVNRSPVNASMGEVCAFNPKFGISHISCLHWNLSPVLPAPSSRFSLTGSRSLR